MAKPRFTKEYLDYIQFTRDTQWDWDFIHTWLKQTEDHVQYYYDTYTQDEFNEKLKTDENFIKKFNSKMKKQTAVEYIIEKLQSAQWEYTPWPERRKIIEQAKQMEKEQVMNSYNDGYRDGMTDLNSNDKDISEFSNAKLYFDETFKK